MQLMTSRNWVVSFYFTSGNIDGRGFVIIPIQIYNEATTPTDHAYAMARRTKANCTRKNLSIIKSISQ